MSSFINKLKGTISSSIAEGNIYLANEITANLMVGTATLIMAILMVGVWILNEVGVFTADKELMRIIALITIVVSVVLCLLTRIFSGEKKWLKYVLIFGLIIECGGLVCVLGHNVTLVTVIPIILSIRYFEKKLSLVVALVSAGMFFVSTLVCAYIGILNLNVLPIDPGTQINIIDGLRSAINKLDIDRDAYMISYLQNDFAPRAIIFIVIAIFSCIIAKRGRQMIDLQNETTTKTARIATELNLATEIQTSMLPCALPAFPDHEQLELYARNTPAKEVGGDFYDYFRVDNDHVAVVMADVSGKGVGAALFMMISKTVVKNQLMLGLEPAQALTNANAQLCENNTAGLFVTTWAGVYEVSTGILRFVNAGHNPPIIKKHGEECYYHKGKTGFVLAGMDGVRYKQSEIVLNRGDELFLYTDGVTEATNKDRDLYGEDRLLDCLGRLSEKEIKTQIEEVFKDINDFADGAEQFDDITMLGMKIH